MQLNNRISKAEPDEPARPNEPNGFNVTNLHTHGLHVSPENNSDNVFLEIGPEQSQTYCFDIPNHHTAGTFWYHAHRHGSTALQLTSGMAGPLLIGGGLDEIPQIAAAMSSDREKILVFQQLTFSLDENGIGQVTKGDVYGNAVQRRVKIDKCKQFQATLINGVHRPVITMKPGEIQRWRCIHAGVIEAIPLSIRESRDENNHLWLYEIARDGLPLYRMERVASVQLYPGYRSDFLVQAPGAPGDYLLKQEGLPASRALNGVAQDPTYLALIRVIATPPVSMNLPDYQSIGAFALHPIEADELANRRPIPLVFEADRENFFVNGAEFDHDRVDLYPRLGSAEEWALSSLQDTHPFHIHVNPFEVFETTDSGIKRYWRDTLVVTQRNPPWNPIYVRMRFQTFPGKTVLHCHNLVHEDRGMMMPIQIVGNPPSSPCSPTIRRGLGDLPVKAPVWQARDTEGRQRTMSEYDSDKVLLVFFRGMACGHCRRQLTTLTRHRDSLAEQELKVIAICPDSPRDLKRGLRDEKIPASFELLSDENLDAFRSYGCHDGGPLHGVFLIDRKSTVRWQSVGDEPFMEIEELVKQGKELE